MERTSGIKEDLEKENTYDLSFKLKVVQEIEQGEISTFDACLKYGIKNRSIIMDWLREKKRLGFKIKPKKNSIEMMKSLELKIMKMEIKLEFFEFENKILKRKLNFLTKRNKE